MAGSMTNGHPPERHMTGWHALTWFIAFFGFMFIVNGIFLWAAISSFPGEDVEKSYIAGMTYNQELTRRQVQAEAGWTGEIGLKQTGETKWIEARLKKADGTPLAGLSARALLRHPSDRNLDTELDMIATATGVFAAPATALARGQWTIVVTADIDPGTEGDEFTAYRRLIVE